MYYILTVGFIITLMIIIFCYINVGITLYKSVKQAGCLRGSVSR